MRIGYPIFTCLLYGFLLAETKAATTRATPANYRGALSQLAPGDTLILEAGLYERGLPLENRHGTPDAWITIQGPEQGVAEIRQSQPANCVELWHCQYVALKRLHIQGSGVSGQFGISAKGGLENTVHHILVEDCLISDFDTSQQAVGISTKTPTWGWTIRRNTIRRCGTGLYLGNSTGHDPFIHGLIEHNLVHDPIGYCMEIKFQKPRPNLPDMPIQTGSTIIRHNVFLKNDAPSPDGDRPNVLVGGFPDTGLGSSDLYEIYGNLFHHNPRESLLQASGRVSIHDNLFAHCQHPNYAAIRLSNHDLPLRFAQVYHNTIIASTRGISLATAPADGHAIIGNLIFADRPLMLSNPAPLAEENQTGTVADATNHLKAPNAKLGHLDLSPLPGQCQGRAIDLSRFTSDTDFDRDFSGQVKTTRTHRGAHTAPSPPTAWKPSQTIKPQPAR